MSLRTPLSRVRGLGSAREGTDHFWLTRLTSIALIFLAIFLLYTAISLAGAPHAAVKAYFASPIIAALMILLIIASAYHMQMGMQVIIEDYVHSEGPKIILLILNTFFSALVGLASVLAVLKLSFGA